MIIDRNADKSLTIGIAGTFPGCRLSLRTNQRETKMYKFIRNSAFGMFLSFMLAGSAGAYQFSMDSFEIERPGNFFTDNFNDGTPPPVLPNIAPGISTANYSVAGTMGPENVGNNGKLVLNQSGAVFNTGLLGTASVVSQYARLDTNTNSSNFTDGLKRNMDFNVVGIFDLIAPAVGEYYGIRLDDQVNNIGSDFLDLRVRNLNADSYVQENRSNRKYASHVRPRARLGARTDHIGIHAHG